jgi:hypothetical protein
MLALKYLLVILGIGLFGSSGALVVYDIYLSSQLRRLLGRRRSDATGELLPEASAEPDRPSRESVCQGGSGFHAVHIAAQAETD